MGNGEQGEPHQELGSNARSGLGMLFLLGDTANLPCVGCISKLRAALVCLCASQLSLGLLLRFSDFSFPFVAFITSTEPFCITFPCVYKNTEGKTQENRGNSGRFLMAFKCFIV